jgi:succinate dehydrogenase/fumarate reductase flavoprotein subunit
MTERRVVETDVLVIGGGITGSFAAIKARDAGATVAVADKGTIGRSGQSPYVDSHLVFNPEWGDDLEGWLAMVSHVGEYLVHRDWTRIGLVESHERYLELVGWGVEFAKNPDGSLYRRPSLLGPTKTLFMPPMAIPDTLREQMRLRHVRLFNRTMIFDLIRENGRVIGALGVSTWKDDISLVEFRSKAVVLACGASGLKGPHWPIHMLTGDGDAMAFRAGASITGKEFIDPHPVNALQPASFNWNIKFGGKKLQDLGPPQGPIINALGEKIPQRGTLYPDLEFEAHAGRAPLTFFPTRESLEPMPWVGGGALGMSIHKAEGVWARDLHGYSGVPGLWAAGDALGSMASGATYAAMGLSSANCAVTGARAGTAAADYARGAASITPSSDTVSAIEARLRAPAERAGGFTAQWLISLLQNLVSPYYMLHIKRGDRLEAALTLLQFQREHVVPKLYARNMHDLRLAHEAANMALNVEMRLRASLFRTESRGCHYREDHPYRDDNNWLCWILIRQGREGEEPMVLEKAPVPEAWRPDPGLSYEQRYDWRLPGEARP